MRSVLALQNQSAGYPRGAHYIQDSLRIFSKVNKKSFFAVSCEFSFCKKLTSARLGRGRPRARRGDMAIALHGIKISMTLDTAALQIGHAAGLPLDGSQRPTHFEHITKWRHGMSTWLRGFSMHTIHA